MVKRIVALAALAACHDTSDPGALVPPTADQDSALPQVAIVVQGHERAVHARAVGDPRRPAVMFLHGSLADSRAFKVFEPLADAHYLIFWDQRGNGLSERISEGEYNRASIVEEIDRVRAAFVGDRKVTLVGHSFGGLYASLYASERREQVDGLVLLEPAALDGVSFNETFSDIINISLFDLGMNEMFWQNLVFAPDAHESLDLRALMVLLNGRQTRYHCDRDHPPPLPVWRPGGYVEYLRSKVLGGSVGFAAPTFDFDFARGLDSFAPEVLIIGGSCSALGPAYQTRWNAPRFRAARVMTINNAGHRLFVEKSDEVVAAVRTYLDR